MRYKGLAGLFFLLVAGPVFGQTAPACAPPQNLEFDIVKRTERSERNFTEGFEYYKGTFFESTGAFEGPTKLNLLQKDGTQKVLNDSIQTGTFGEGLTVFGDRVYQATWQDKVMFVFDLKGSYKQSLSFPYTGWGMTHDGVNLILTDGTPTLRFLSPSDLSVKREVQIKMGSELQAEVNELEWIDGKIFGNIFTSKNIVRIDPSTGCIDGMMDASILLNELPEEEIKYINSNNNFVLNGIAYNAAKKEIFLTGKNWKYIFTVKIRN